jgi:hypothetical protein
MGENVTSENCLLKFLVQSGFLIEEPSNSIFTDQPLGIIACLDRNKICNEDDAIKHVSKVLAIKAVDLDQ